MTTGPEKIEPDLSIDADLTPDLADDGPLDPEPDDPRLGSVLFVDDDAYTLMSLRAGLSLSLPGWQLAFAESAEQGLDRLHGREVDVVVAAPQLTDMTGGEFLQRARELSPATGRIVLSDTGDPAEPGHVRKADDTAQQVADQVVTMPTDAATLGMAIRTAREAKWEAEPGHAGPEPVHIASPLPGPREGRPAHRA